MGEIATLARPSTVDEAPKSTRLGVQGRLPIILEESFIDIYRRARKEYPRECCGWLAGDEECPDIVRPCENMQDQGNHPIAPGRTAETAYVFSPVDLLALNRSFDSDQPARIIYHSHTNGRAYLSNIDRRAATSPWGDEPAPAYDVLQLVVGIDGQRLVEAALFEWSDDAKDFVEVKRFCFCHAPWRTRTPPDSSK